MWQRIVASCGSIFLAAVSLEAQTATTLLRSGGTGAKRDLVIIGDGFQAGADQATYNTFVDTYVMAGVFAEGPLWEDMNAFNIYRINVESTDSGVTQVDADGNVTTARNTALDYRFSGNWDRCWMEPGPNTASRLSAILASLTPARDFVFIVLNEPNFGGCRRGNQLAVTLGTNWTVGAHEMGHMVGNLADEYCGCGTYGGNPRYWVLNDAQAGFGSMLCAGGATWGSGNYATSIAFGDVDGDGRDEVGIARRAGGNARYWVLDDAQNGFAQLLAGGADWGSGNYATSIAFGNIDGDGRDEAGVARHATAGGSGADEPSRVNVTVNRNRATLKWRDFVNPSTPVPTGINPTPGNGACTGHNQGTMPPGWSDDDDAGLFEGAKYNDSGIYRPVVNCRMLGNTPDFCPVCYNRVKKVLDPFHDHTYLSSYVGDFTGDGRSDVVIHNGNSLALYQSVGTELEPLWIATGEIPLWDDFMPGDRFYVGDFDNDGRDDLYVFNASDWAIPYFAMLRSTGNGFECIRRFDLELPGWDDMRAHDQFYVADFDGDGSDDVYVFNGRDWSMGYLEMLRSTGSNLVYTRRYDDSLPGWGRMEPHDQFYVADIDAEGKKDLYIFNGSDWAVGYLQLLGSTGSALQHIRRYDEELPGWDDMKPRDQFFVADFDADGTDDLFVFNGHDWSIDYLQMLRSTGTAMANTRRFDGDVPGWNGLASGDQFFVADVNGDRRDDLYVYNGADWATEYLGTLRSTGTNLTGSWQEDWIGSWNLGASDRFLVGNFNGGAGWDDVFVRNKDWFGLLRSHSASVQLTALYPDWIHRHNYHRLGWW